MGRTSPTGPASGGYIVHTVSQDLIASRGGIFRWRVPFPCKIVHVSAANDDLTGTTAYAVDTTNGNVIPSQVFGDGEALMEVWTPGGANDLDGVASGANRVLAEGEDLDVTMTTAAASTLVGGCVTVTLRVTGQPTAWAATAD